MRSKVFFPNQLIKLMTHGDAVKKLPANQLAFRVAPSMTKNEIKEHLEKIYELPVEVRTLQRHSNSTSRRAQPRPPFTASVHACHRQPSE